MADRKTFIMEMEQEIWRPITGYEGILSVSSLGRIRRDHLVPQSHLRDGMLTPVPVAHGYLMVGLKHNGTKKMALMHRLVAAAFLGPCPKGLEVNHKNHDKTDNRASNLEYVTRTANMRHAQKQGKLRGAITEKKALEIGSLLARGYSRRALAIKYSIALSVIDNIARGKSWAFLLDNPEHADNLERAKAHRFSALRGINNPNSKLTVADVSHIRKLYSTGEYTQTALSRRFGVSQTTIYRIVGGKIWKQLIE